MYQQRGVLLRFIESEEAGERLTDHTHKGDSRDVERLYSGGEGRMMRNEGG